MASVITHPHSYSCYIAHNYPRTVLAKTIADGISQKKWKEHDLRKEERNLQKCNKIDLRVFFEFRAQKS